MARHAPINQAAHDVDVVLIATQDRAIPDVADAIEPGAAAVLHCSGATTLVAVSRHERHGSIHPLMALPDTETGAERLRSGGWFAVAGDPVAAELVTSLAGRSFEVADEHRALYHATAAVGANHLVALLAQVERLATQVGVPVEAFFDLAAGSFADVRSRGAKVALTGPAARGDHATLAAHIAALPEAERELYQVLADAAGELGQRP